jgi:hypothetical protein
MVESVQARLVELALRHLGLRVCCSFVLCHLLVTGRV